jgi:hypothetical protein
MKRPVATLFSLLLSLLVFVPISLYGGVKKEDLEKLSEGYHAAYTKLNESHSKLDGFEKEVLYFSECIGNDNIKKSLDDVHTQLDNFNKKQFRDLQDFAKGCCALRNIVYSFTKENEKDIDVETHIGKMKDSVDKLKLKNEGTKDLDGILSDFNDILPRFKSILSKAQINRFTKDSDSLLQISNAQREMIKDLDKIVKHPLNYYLSLFSDEGSEEIRRAEEVQ